MKDREESLNLEQGSVMKWLKKILGFGGVDTEAVMDHSLQLARSGQQVEAISQMQAAVDAVKESAGALSCEHAKGLFNLAMLHIAVGDMQRGAEDCRLAADSCPDSITGRKDRLMYLMNAGQLLSRADRTDEAIEVLQTSLDEREQAYGAEHAGTAYGQQALAEVYMSAGRFAEGLELSEKALDTFFHESHQEYPTALATTTALASAVGMHDDEVWQYATSDAATFAKPMIDSALVLAEAMPDCTGMNYLRQLADWAGELLPPDSPQMMNVIALWSNIATDKGDHSQRELAMSRAVTEAKRLGDPAVIVNVLEGRALMLSDIDSDAEAVRAAYQDALDKAVEHDLESDAAGVLRNWALYESEAGNSDAAVKRFQQAIEKSRAVRATPKPWREHRLRSASFTSTTTAAKKRHRCWKKGSRSWTRCIPMSLAPCCIKVALSENLDCPCHGGDSIATDAMGKLAERFFNRSGLEDIIESVSYGDADGEKGLNVQLSREPSDQEMQRLGIAHGVFQNLLSNADTRTRG